MLTEKEIRKVIKKLEVDYKHVLACGPASVQINAPRALMQVGAVAQLGILYEILGEKRPRFACDDSRKTDQ